MNLLRIVWLVWSRSTLGATIHYEFRFSRGVREALGIVVGTSISSGCVVRFLDQLVAEHVAPRRIRLDNGPEMTPWVFTEWCEAKGIKLICSQPGKPTENAFDRFNRLLRTEVLGANLF